MGAMFESFEAGDIPDEVRALEETLGPLANEYDNFLDNESDLAGYPQQSFWAAFEKFRETIERPQQETPLRPLESIKQLHDEKVTHNQIAKMYGLVDERGNPQGHLIQKELDAPGSVIGPDWKDPRVKELEAKRSAASRHAAAIQKARTPNPKAPPCPETPRELWEQRVSVEQSAKMLQQTEDEVRAQFAKWDDEVHQATKDKAKANTPPAKPAQTNPAGTPKVKK